MSHIDSELKQYIERRAEESHVPPEKIGLAIDEAPEFDYLDPSTQLWEIAGAYDGSVDFEIITTGLYEVNIADWIAEFYAEKNPLDPHTEEPVGTWEITVTPYVKDETTGEWFTHMSQGYEPTYKVSSESYDG